MLRSRSAEGLNFSSFELENIAFSIHTAYGIVLGLPFSAFGEAVIILLQNTFLLACIYYYARAPIWRAILMIILTAVGGAWVASGLSLTVLLPHSLPQSPSMLLATCLACVVQCSNYFHALHAGNATPKMVMSAYELNNFIFMAARIPQIIANYKVWY